MPGLFNYASLFGGPTILAALLMFVISPYAALVHVQGELADGGSASVISSVDVEAARDYYFTWLERQYEPYVSMMGKIADKAVDVGSDAFGGEDGFNPLKLLSIVPFGDLLEHEALVRLRASVERNVTDRSVAAYVARVLPAEREPSSTSGLLARIGDLVRHRDSRFRYDYTDLMHFEVSRAAHTIVLCRYGLFEWRVCGLHDEDLITRQAKALAR